MPQLRATATELVEWVDSEAAAAPRPSYLYRYVSLTQCLSLLQNKELVLVDPSSWPDKYEGAVSQAILDQEPDYIRAHVRAICFSTKQASHALWKIFGDPKPVIRLRFRIDGLESALRSYTGDGAKTFLVRVQYLTAPHIRAAIKKLRLDTGTRKARDVAQLVGLKRAIFSYEQEIRVVRVTRVKVGAVIRIPIVLSKVVDQILIDPYIRPGTATTLISVFRRICGLHIDIAQSVIDEEP